MKRVGVSRCQSTARWLSGQCLNSRMTHAGGGHGSERAADRSQCWVLTADASLFGGEGCVELLEKCTLNFFLSHQIYDIYME
jgi:hypothetical protein